MPESDAQMLAKVVFRALGVGGVFFGAATAIHGAVLMMTLESAGEEFNYHDSYVVVDFTYPATLVATGVLLFLLAPLLASWVAK